MIGDPIVSPIAHAAHYSETLALMPNCFQPNNRQRAVGAAPQPRSSRAACARICILLLQPKLQDNLGNVRLVVPVAR